MADKNLDARNVAERVSACMGGKRDDARNVMGLSFAYMASVEKDAMNVSGESVSMGNKRPDAGSVEEEIFVRMADRRAFVRNVEDRVYVCHMDGTREVARSVVEVHSVLLMAVGRTDVKSVEETVSVNILSVKNNVKSAEEVHSVLLMAGGRIHVRIVVEEAVSVHMAGERPPVKTVKGAPSAVTESRRAAALNVGLGPVIVNTEG
jgi:hypothetical protein